jgi:hypothetical protein
MRLLDVPAELKDATYHAAEHIASGKISQNCSLSYETNISPWKQLFGIILDTFFFRSFKKWELVMRCRETVDNIDSGSFQDKRFQSEARHGFQIIE